MPDSMAICQEGGGGGGEGVEVTSWNFATVVWYRFIYKRFWLQIAKIEITDNLKTLGWTPTIFN